MATWRLSQADKQKYALAQRLGLMDKLAETGWAGLPAKDTGRIGGSMRRGARPR